MIQQVTTIHRESQDLEAAMTRLLKHWLKSYLNANDIDWSCRYPLTATGAIDRRKAESQGLNTTTSIRPIPTIRLGSDEYRELVAATELARRMVEKGVRFTCVVSGGGPGAMEATHLGALLAGAGDLALDEALAELAAVPRFPDTRGLVGPDGVFDRGVLASLHRWQRPAFALLDEVDEAGRGESLAIPTWFYGHEPPTPFATCIAKYFSNPLREDGLLSIAVDGVVYAPGWAGTVQEIFQDATQNVYRVVDGRISPMAFLDTDRCWTERLPVLPVLQALFGPDEYARSVRVSTDLGEIATFLGA